MNLLELAQPAIGPTIGGLLAIAGGYFQSKRMDKATKEAERRKLSHDSARQITAELTTLSSVLRRHQQGFDLTIEGDSKLEDSWAVIRHHALYLSDPDLQDLVIEAGKFLLPPSYFSHFVGKSMPWIVKDVESWLAPQMQAHIKGCPVPAEPKFLEIYRSAHADAEEEERERNEAYEEFEAQERARLRAERETAQPYEDQPTPSADGS